MSGAVRPRRRDRAVRPRHSGELGRRLAAGLAALFWVSPLGAQEAPPGGFTESPVVAALRQQPSNDWGFRWEDHPRLDLGRGTWIDFRARVQGDLRKSEAALGDPAAFDVARRRIGVEGRIAGVADYQIEYEISSDDRWRDVYIDYRQFTSLQVQAGKFKLPFSLDENTSATNLDFVYRSRAATQLAPGRDRGVMVHGRVARVLQYDMGIFDHDGRNARTNNPEHVFGGQTAAGRATLQPFRSSRSPLSDLQFGVAFTGSDVPEGIAALRGRTALDAPFFPADLWVRGHRRRVGLEARWRPGPYSVKAEYIRVQTERRGQSVEDSDLSPFVGTGWYISGTWLATGERKSSGADNPRRPLFRGGFGALEFAVRLEALRFGSTSQDGVPSTSPRADVVLGNRDRAATVGVNWYPYRRIKIQGNVIREELTDPARGPLPSQPGFWSRVFRVQLTL
jgi:phosphate-selective porin OprO and OprP